MLVVRSRSRAGWAGVHDGSMQITRFGHAALLVEAAGSRILIDPGVFSSDDAFALTDLDAIVVTHQHPDHVDQDRLPGVLGLNPGATLLSDPETSAVLGGGWLENADGLETVVGRVTVRGVGARHAEILPTIPRVGNVGVLLIAPDEPVLFHPGDTYEYVPAGVDVLALPLSAPWAKASETLDFAQRVAPRTMFPIHDRTISELAYGIYWGQVSGHSGIDDARLLGQSESTTVSAPGRA
jgi:L-ascorbate metabolism protein UlaG (beta-lactamase superfamily)